MADIGASPGVGTIARRCARHDTVLWSAEGDFWGASLRVVGEGRGGAVRRSGRWPFALWLLAAAGMLPGAAAADDNSPTPSAAAAPEDWSLHFQLTGIYQGDFGFPSSVQGPNSLSGDQQWRETISGTAYIGRRLPWSGGELYFDPEFNQGFGLSRSHGVAGFPNGEAVKAGFNTPKPNVARLFLRQTFGLGGDQEVIAPDENQLGKTIDISRLTITAGKFAVTDIFDDNSYAHDPRTDFLNLSINNSAAWDAPADAKGYTDGVAVELNERDWAFRWGALLQPKVANDRDLEPRFWKTFGLVAEVERRYRLWGEPGKLRVLGFLNRAPMANLEEAAALGGNLEAARSPRYKGGFALNGEQALTDTLGVFGRFSMNDGQTETWAFTDVDRSTVLGASLKGTAWGRPQDTLALAAAVNELSKPHRDFFTVGGLGIFVGDGQLAYAPETIVETYYNLQIVDAVGLTFDYQFVANPAYNRARGPVSILAARLHFEL
jgi:high affinity Mn2+ porin